MTDLEVYEEQPEVLTGEVMEFKLLSIDEPSDHHVNETWLIEYRSKQYAVIKGDAEVTIHEVVSPGLLLSQETLCLPGDHLHVAAIAHLEGRIGSDHHSGPSDDFNWEDIWGSAGGRGRVGFGPGAFEVSEEIIEQFRRRFGL